MPTMGGEWTFYQVLICGIRDMWSEALTSFPTAEFTKLKQTWQQKGVRSYKETDGQEILPGFVGRRYA